MQFSTAIPTSEQKANKAFYKVMQSAPMGLLVCAALGLGIVGVFQFIYYNIVLPASWSFGLVSTLSALLAIFFEALGFFFLVTTVRDFSARAYKEGALGLVATVLLWVYSLWECMDIAATFDNDTASTNAAITGILITIICAVRIVEFRITLTVNSSIKQKEAENNLAAQVAHFRTEAETATGKLQEAENTVLRFKEAMEGWAHDRKDLEAEIEQMKTEKEQDRKAITTYTGKLEIFEAEKQRQQEAEMRERKRQQEQEAEKERQRLLELEAENERLRQSRASSRGASISAVSRETMERKAKEFFERNSIPPTQQQLAEICGLKDAKSVRLQFPNGTWEALLLSLSQAETTQQVNS